ncbi:MAG: M20 family metallo-hydrolase [Candidatus Riflebacteria bacterium]|nr:M20 family metallo-hydrolase [Candidatus Riflebacteria bacterium]
MEGCPFLRGRTRGETNLEQSILGRIDRYEDLAIDLQRGLVSIPAIAPSNGGTGELDKAEWLQERLEELPFDRLERLDAPDPAAKGGVRPNLVARWNGLDPDRTLWIVGHLDVVPPGQLGLWKTDPFALRVEGRRLYGRGVEDNHQGMIAAILAARSLMQEKLRPPTNLALLFAADEETGNRFGTDFLVDHYPEMFGKHDSFIVPDCGKADATLVEISEKSVLWLRIRTLGRQSHAAVPERGRNALVAASDLIVKLHELRHRFDKVDPLFVPPTSTFVATKREANVPNINTIPGEDVFYMDCRILPGYTIAEVMGALEDLSRPIARKYQVAFEFDPVYVFESAAPTPVESPVVREVMGAIQTVYGVRSTPAGIGGGTMAANFRRLGLSAAVFSRVENTAHQPDECCNLDNLLGDAKVFALASFRLRG